MAEKKGGAGKFFLGALLGGIAGAVAGKFIKTRTDSGEDLDEIECDCDECDCDECDHCEKKEEKIADKTEKAKKSTGAKK